MFVINPYLRIALMAAGIIGGIILWIAYGFWYGFPFLLAGIILLVGYIFLGTVGSAAKAMQTMDFERSEKLLNLTLNPKWLYATNRAYFYMIKGSVALQQKDMEKGEQYLKMAEEIDVPTDNEKAMLQLQLANIAASKNNWKKANIHYRNLKGMKITDPNVKEQLAQFDKVMAQRGQQKVAQRMGGGRSRNVMQPGGKRRRPKMR
jgi:tetratricopeptide (TPR) repeat protein